MSLENDICGLKHQLESIINQVDFQELLNCLVFKKDHEARKCKDTLKDKFARLLYQGQRRGLILVMTDGL